MRTNFLSVVIGSPSAVAHAWYARRCVYPEQTVLQLTSYSQADIYGRCIWQDVHHRKFSWRRVSGSDQRNYWTGTQIFRRQTPRNDRWITYNSIIQFGWPKQEECQSEAL